MSFAANEKKVTAAYVQQFHDTFDIDCQQDESRLESTVHNRGKITGASFTVNDMGAIEMNDTVVRFGDTVWNLPDAGTRTVLMNDKDLHIPVWKQDVQKMLADVRGPYMKLTKSAADRKKDEVIYRALLDPVMRKTEENGTPTAVVLPANQIVAANGQPVTKQKLIFAKSLFRANECDEQNGEELYIAYDSNMLIQILGDTTLTSADFMAVKMLQEGQVAGKWLGYNWVAYEKLDKSAGVARSAAWCKSAVHFGTGEDYDVDIGPRRDKNNTIQISVTASYGAGRANEKKVVALDFVV